MSIEKQTFKCSCCGKKFTEDEKGTDKDLPLCLECENKYQTAIPLIRGNLIFFSKTDCSDFLDVEESTIKDYIRPSRKKRNPVKKICSWLKAFEPLLYKEIDSFGKYKKCYDDTKKFYEINMIKNALVKDECLNELLQYMYSYMLEKDEKKKPKTENKLCIAYKERVENKKQNIAPVILFMFANNLFPPRRKSKISKQRDYEKEFEHKDNKEEQVGEKAKAYYKKAAKSLKEFMGKDFDILDLSEKEGRRCDVLFLINYIDVELYSYYVDSRTPQYDPIDFKQIKGLYRTQWPNEFLKITTNMYVKGNGSYLFKFYTPKEGVPCCYEYDVRIKQDTETENIMFEIRSPQMIRDSYNKNNKQIKAISKQSFFYVGEKNEKDFSLEADGEIKDDKELEFLNGKTFIAYDQDRCEGTPNVKRDIAQFALTKDYFYIAFEYKEKEKNTIEKSVIRMNNNGSMIEQMPESLTPNSNITVAEIDEDEYLKFEFDNAEMSIDLYDLLQRARNGSDENLREVDYDSNFWE